MFLELYSSTTDKIDISITAQIDGKGDLSIMGRDTGKLVKELKGDWEYEYNLTVRKADKELLINRLREDLEPMKSDKDLMDWLKVNYSHNEAYSAFAKLLSEMNIKYDRFMWP